MIERAALDVFAERGYHGASIDEIARRSGVTPPVVYDHFESKLDLHRRLLERTRDELLEMWREQLGGDEPARGPHPARARRLGALRRGAPLRAADVLLRDHRRPRSRGDPPTRSRRRRAAALGAILGGEPGAERIAGSADAEALEMAAEVIRSGLTGLAIWWSDHPEVPRERIVATAVNAVWIGFERVSRGEGWKP